jgi:CheY-like chemotaxis protein
MKVLVIEDDEAVQKFICKILVSAGHSVVAAGNGKEGLAEIKKNNDVSIVITDLIMPVKEGIETITDIKKFWPHVKILAISGGGIIDPEFYLRNASALGADLTLKKPFTRPELLSAVENLSVRK